MSADPSDTHSPLEADPSRFAEAIAQIDAANGADPNLVEVQGEQVPYELFYARELTRWIQKLRPEAPQPLLIAGRCQHICRWQIARKSYPEGRVGYLKWRSDLKQFHAAKSGEILSGLEFSPAFIERVQNLNLKKGLGQDEEVQTLEDALCLMTLQYQLADLMRKTEREKLISVLQKTWRKMSPAGQAAALALEYPEDQKQLLTEALSPGRDPA